jgi:uncharacterized protein YgiM (DUF1202 family)
MKLKDNGPWAVLVLVIGLACLPGLALAETMFVQAKTAQLRSGKTSLDNIVANLKYGDELEVLKRDGNWVEAKTVGGARGWIFANKLTASKPSGGSDTFAQLGRSMRRADASGATASAGARGLDKASEGYANRAGISQQDRDAVDRMTAYQLTDQEVEEFLKEGGLGEYAK